MTDDDAASSFGDADTFTDDEFGGRDAWAESSQERGRVKSEAAVGEETKMEATRSDGGRLPHHRPSSSFSALGVPAIVRLDGTGPGGARAMGLPSWYRDTGDEMRQRVKVGGRVGVAVVVAVMAVVVVVIMVVVVVVLVCVNGGVDDGRSDAVTGGDGWGGWESWGGGGPGDVMAGVVVVVVVLVLCWLWF